jgi:hypothetical protein
METNYLIKHYSKEDEMWGEVTRSPDLDHIKAVKEMQEGRYPKEQYKIFKETAVITQIEID